MPQMPTKASKDSKRSYGIAMTPPRGNESYLKIRQVIEGGVAEQAGLQTGDKIVSINGHAVAGLELEKLRGFMGQSPLALDVDRGDERLGFELSLD